MKYARLGESVQEIVLEAGATTVADFREQCFDGETVKVKRSGQVLDDDTELQNGDVLVVANKHEKDLSRTKIWSLSNLLSRRDEKADKPIALLMSP